MIWSAARRERAAGEMMGIPPTGRTISLLSPNIARIRDGRAAEHWSDQSMFQFLQQIGALG